MPALPSFINKPSWRAKAAIRSPFSLLRGEPSTSTAVPVPPAVPPAGDVLDIKEKGRYSDSLDFDGGRPTSGFTSLLDYKSNSSAESPQVKLELDVSPEALTEWFEASFLQAQSFADVIPSESRTAPFQTDQTKSLEASGKAGQGFRGQGLTAVDTDDGYSTVSEDIIGNLGLDTSQFASGSRSSNEPNQSQGSLSRNRAMPISLAIPSSPPAATSPNSFSRPFSILDTPTSSALSGTTLARALLSNTFSLSNDTRSSRYRSGAAGLTRTDSTTLPRGEHPYFTADRFSVGPDAPPLPNNAGVRYEAPKKNRGGLKRDKSLKRHGSTGSMGPVRRLPATPATPSPRPNSALFGDELRLAIDSLGNMSDSEPVPPSPRPPLPLPPSTSPKPFHSTPDLESPDNGLISYEEAMRVSDHTQPLSSSDDSDLLSPTPSSDGPLSGKNLEEVLDYYNQPNQPNLPESLPEPITGPSFHPVFSPISEESPSQLSPPVPFRSERRDSRPIGARSPLTGSLRARGESLPMQRRPAGARFSTRQASLGPIGERDKERPLSMAEPSSPTYTQTSHSLYSNDSDYSEPLDASQSFDLSHRRQCSIPVSLPFGLQEEASNTNPVLTTLPPSATPTAGEGTFISQQNHVPYAAFSPAMHSQDKPSSRPHSGEGLEVSRPTTPTTSALSKGSQTNLAQQVLLQQTVSNSPHINPQLHSKTSNSPSINRSGSYSNLRHSDTFETTSFRHSIQSVEYPKRISQNSLEPPAAGASVTRSPSYTQNSDAASMYTTSSHNSNGSISRLKSLPFIPSSPLIIQPHSDALFASPEPSPVLPSSAEVIIPPESQGFHTYSSPSPSPSPSPQIRQPGPRSKLPNAITINNRYSGPDLAPVPVNESDNTESPPSSVAPTSSNSLSVPYQHQEEEEEPPIRYKSDVFSGRSSDIFRGTSLGSPPPYYTVVSDAIMRDTQAQSPGSGPSLAPPLSSSSSGQISVLGTLHHESTSTVDSSRLPLVRENSMTMGPRGGRARPAVMPQGPRRPSQQLVHSAGPPFLPGPAGGRERTGSISSVSSNPLPLPRQSQLSQHSQPSPSSRPNLHFSPKFHVPPPKWRGYTMEAAKWTFSSAQLQEIVSRAIRQSAEASTIRLLRQDVLDNEIPHEIRRLEAQRTDLKTRYKVLTKRRTLLFDNLAVQLGGGSVEDSANAVRLLDDLREMALTLDRLAEELHSLDEQLSYLYSLTHIHSGSALSMALRKLNTSFLKQAAENQVLRNQINSLEAERDEAWQQAERVAQEIDTMSAPNSQRSSRVMAVRKSTIRVSRAGLRSAPSRRSSQRSSVASSIYGGPPISARSPIGMRERVPPVPPIPRPRPLDLRPESPLRDSALSTGGSSPPSTEDRALVQAENELYTMLGLAPPEHRLRRTRSANGTRRESTPPGSALPGFLSGARSPDPVHSGRRASLPPTSTLAETYNIMAADRHAVLATIDMLSSTDL